VPTPDTPPTAVATATFAAPVTARDVWLYRLDFANLPEYNPDVSGVARVREGAADGVGGLLGPGARYTFRLADARQEGVSHPVELWLVDVVEPSLVAAGMAGGSEAYEEFVVRAADAADAADAVDGGGCEATLTLWVTLPDGLPDDVVAAAAAGSLAQIQKEVRLMKEVLEARAGVAPSG
jgi:hypothetical protein